MATRTIELSDELAGFVAAEIESGRFRDADAVLRAGLELLEEQRREDEAKIANLRALAAEGLAELDQGLGIEINSEEELSAFISRLSEEAAEEVRSQA
jgi:putative addiction module CopG family antidote